MARVAVLIVDRLIADCGQPASRALSPGRPLRVSAIGVEDHRPIGKCRVCQQRAEDQFWDQAPRGLGRSPRGPVA